jgi:hypothetical protein
MRDPRPVAEVIAREGVAAAIAKKHVASLLFTYRCTITCPHCLFNCGPRHPPVFTPIEQAVEYLRQLHATDRVIHIAGGEAMMFYPALLQVCERAGRAGVAPHFIETNATFAVNDPVTRHRLTRLRECGVQGLLISSDPYHQRYCPPERYARCFRIAVEVFGRENVAAAERTLPELEQLRAIGRDPDRLAEYTRRHPPRLVGRAGDELSPLFPPRPVPDLTDAMWHGGQGRADCRQEFDPQTMWEIHIDPYGNIQTCCGIIVGHMAETTLPALMARGFLGRSPVVDAVYSGGPAALLEIAVRRGYRPGAGYPQKCGLCWEVRRFLRPHFPESLGPDEVYTANPSA